MLGDIDPRLLFSPMASIEGAFGIIELTGIFPLCHYEHLLSFEGKEGEMTFRFLLRSIVERWNHACPA
jgi:hypothetical protein